jgi:hypothetical protein
MLFALGVASTAVDVLKTLTSSAQSLAQSSGGGGQGSADPFKVSSPAPASARSTQITTGLSANPQISPATMNALLAAQSPATGSRPTSNGLNSASLTMLGASGTATQTYNAAEQMIQQQPQAMVLTA